MILIKKYIAFILLGCALGLYGLHYFSVSSANHHGLESQIDGTIRYPEMEMSMIASDLNEMMLIKVPSWDLGGDILYTEYMVPKTDIVLDAVYKKIFELEGDDGYEGLKYQSVVMNDGVATLHLSGVFYPTGDLSGAYLRNNINAAAFQFDSVDSIVVHVNGDRFDWCIDDVSDGEGGCPDTPQYWHDAKQKNSD